MRFHRWTYVPVPKTPYFHASIPCHKRPILGLGTCRGTPPFVPSTPYTAENRGLRNQERRNLGGLSMPKARFDVTVLAALHWHVRRQPWLCNGISLAADLGILGSMRPQHYLRYVHRCRVRKMITGMTCGVRSSPYSVQVWLYIQYLRRTPYCKQFGIRYAVRLQ